MVALLAACSSPEAVSGAVGRGDGASAPAYIAVVPLTGEVSAQAMADSLGATLVAGAGSGSLAPASSRAAGATVAYLGFDSMPLGSLSVGGNTVTVEPNLDRFLTSASLEVLGESTVWAEGSNGSLRANGESTVWAEGESTVWAEADPTFWANGESTVWAEGESTVWAEGESTVWAEGESTVWAEGDYKWMPPNTGIWHQIELREAHDKAANLGYGTVVAVIDTGVDLSHPWLAGSIAAGGWDFVDNDDDPSEEGSSADGSYGHGTSVAGIIRQIAPRASIMPLRALAADGSGDVLAVVQAVYHAVDNGADIINLSLGGPEESPALTAALDYADQHGVYVTTTAGNEGQHRINWPGASAVGFNRVISVTSVNVDDHKSDFANFHANVEIAAPGHMVYGPYPDNGIAAWSGTSMAAPAVAGALALALAEQLDVSRGNLQAALLEESANHYRGGRNSEFRDAGVKLLGHGRLDIEEFLDEVLD